MDSVVVVVTIIIIIVIIITVIVIVIVIINVIIVVMIIVTMIVTVIVIIVIIIFTFVVIFAFFCLFLNIETLNFRFLGPCSTVTFLNRRRFGEDKLRGTRIRGRKPTNWQTSEIGIGSGDGL